MLIHSSSYTSTYIFSFFRLCAFTLTMGRLTKRQQAKPNVLAMRKNAKLHVGTATRNPVLPLATTSQSKHSLGTFLNCGSFACCANTCMQALFHVLPVCLIPEDSVMRNIFANHEAKKPQSLDNIRMEIKQGFQTDVHECPANFLSSIIQTPNY